MVGRHQIPLPSDRPAHPRVGTLVQAERGYWAFLPRPLPFDPEVDLHAIQPELSDADAAVGTLSGVADFLPDLELFLDAYVRKDAVLSSQIEGTQASVSDLSAQAAGIDLGSGSGPDDRAEVGNYVQAITGALASMRTRELDLSLILDTHETLLKGTKNEAYGGFLRRDQNWISRWGRTEPGTYYEEAIFVPPLPSDVPMLMDNLVAFMTGPLTVPALVRAGLVHAQFETIHPFVDGNGRLGRMLVTIMLARDGRLSKPLLYWSAFLAPRKGEYYAALTRLRESGDVESWLKFFLRGVGAAAVEATASLRAIVALRTEFSARVRAALPQRRTAIDTLDLLFRLPIVTAETISQHTAVTPPTAYTLIAEFERLGILTEITGNPRGRVWAFKPYLAVLKA